MQQHVLTIAAAALCAAAGPVSAQGALKPVEALIVNPANRPVPVTVVSSPTAPTVRCRLALDVSSASPIVRLIQTNPVQGVVCPAGVTRLDVQRVVLASFVAQHRVFLALGSASAAGQVPETIIGTLSDGAPDLTLARPVRIDFAAPSSPLFIAMQVCSAGNAAIPEACGGDVYLVGTPVN